MRAALDACVLFPTVMREMLLGAAGAGAFVPVWSPRILEEWARAVRRLGDGAEAVARAEIASMRDAWPASEVTPGDDLTGRLSLPDPDDTHVLAAAIAGEADVLVTLNRADFPSRTLARHGVIRRDPDGLLLEWHLAGGTLAGVAEAVRARAEAASGRAQPVRPLLKRAGLPRLGKALTGQGAGSLAG